VERGPQQPADAPGATGPTGAGERIATAALRVPRTARYHVLAPEDPADAPSELWLLLHGYGELAADFLARFTPVASPARLLVAPEGLSRFYLRGGRGEVGASWMTKLERADEIRDYVEYLDLVLARVHDGAAKLSVLGFSQGTATACRWALRPEAPKIARLVLWGGGVPPDIDLGSSTLPRPEIRLVCGRDDRLFRDGHFEAERARLAQAGREPRSILFDGAHEIAAAALDEAFA